MIGLFRFFSLFPSFPFPLSYFVVFHGKSLIQFYVVFIFIFPSYGNFPHTHIYAHSFSNSLVGVSGNGNLAVFPYDFFHWCLRSIHWVRRKNCIFRKSFYIEFKLVYKLFCMMLNMLLLLLMVWGLFDFDKNNNNNSVLSFCFTLTPVYSGIYVYVRIERSDSHFYYHFYSI